MLNFNEKDMARNIMSNLQDKCILFTFVGICALK